MHKNPRQKPHSVSKIRNSVVPCAFAIQHQSGTWRDSDEYGWSSKNVQTDWHPLPPWLIIMFMDFPLCYFHTHCRHDWPSMHIETAGTAWSGLPSDDEEVHGRCEEDIFCFVKEMQCEERTMEVYAASKQLFWTFSAMLMHFQENYGRMICFFVGYFMKKVNFHLACTDDLEVFQSCPIRCDPNQKWRPLLLKPGLLELQFERTQARKIQDAPIVWVYQLIHAKYFTSSDPHQVACHHDIAFLHTVWQVFWQFSFWHAIWLILWHVFWLSIWHTFWHIWWLTLYLTRIMVVTIYLTYFWHSIWHIFEHVVWYIIWYVMSHDMIDIFGQTSWHRFWHSMRINSCNIYIPFFICHSVNPHFTKNNYCKHTRLDHPFLPTSSHAHIIRVYFSRSSSPHWSVVILNVK